MIWRYYNLDFGPMFTLRKCHFKTSGGCVEILVETKANWGKTHILIESNSLCPDGTSLHKTTFPQLSNTFANQLAWSLSLLDKVGRRNWVSGRLLYLLSHHHWLKRPWKEQGKVHLKNNRTFQRKYIPLIEKQLKAVIFRAQNAESFFKQFSQNQ